MTEVLGHSAASEQQIRTVLDYATAKLKEDGRYDPETIDELGPAGLLRLGAQAMIETTMYWLDLRCHSPARYAEVKDAMLDRLYDQIRSDHGLVEGESRVALGSEAQASAYAAARGAGSATTVEHTGEGEWTVTIRPAEAGASIDPARLDRALRLQARRTAPGCYEITGGSAPHAVKLGVGWCDCPDHCRSGVTCKHLLAARIVDGDPVVCRAAEERVRELNHARAA